MQTDTEGSQIFTGLHKQCEERQGTCIGTTIE